MDDAQLSLPGIVYQGEIPQEAIDYLGAVHRHYDAMTVRLQDVHMAALLHLSVRQWQRRKHDLRSGRWGGYDWLEGVWPPDAHWHPSWEGRGRSIAQAHAPEADGLLIFRRIDPAFDQHGNAVVLEYEETYDADGVFLSRRLIRPSRNGMLGHLSALAAGLSAVTSLDLSDGHLDGVLHWCYVLLAYVMPHARSS